MWRHAHFGGSLRNRPFQPSIWQRSIELGSYVKGRIPHSPRATGTHCTPDTRNASTRNADDAHQTGRA
ncbi:hypothetical protein SB847_21250, partial [Bacillus sp. SIMBA_026]|uniref:hypothetical protein n=1 Tax=Bacillus sp. SIMBA_026 TaxID=3085769 RepID=UPI003979E473